MIHADGGLGTAASFDGERVEIHGPHGTVLPVSAIAAVQLSGGRWSRRGFIRFVPTGETTSSPARTIGLDEAMTDEHAVVFTRERRAEFQHLKAAVEGALRREATAHMAEVEERIREKEHQLRELRNQANPIPAQTAKDCQRLLDETRERTEEEVERRMGEARQRFETDRQRVREHADTGELTPAEKAQALARIDSAHRDVDAEIRRWANGEYAKVKQDCQELVARAEREVAEIMSRHDETATQLNELRARSRRG